uniref:Uncharacterized protein n=1 Tax=Cacopsylla melanoneura TaxID=428564 RepID=A0A8D9E1L2_9HEMI
MYRSATGLVRWWWNSSPSKYRTCPFLPRLATSHSRRVQFWRASCRTTHARATRANTVARVLSRGTISIASVPGVTSPKPVRKKSSVSSRPVLLIRSVET